MSASVLPAEPFSYNHERRGSDGWAEWSTDTSERHSDGTPIPGTKPHRLFVRVSDGLVEIVDAEVTSYNPGARELDLRKRGTSMLLTNGLGRWLHAALGRALDEQERQAADEGDES